MQLPCALGLRHHSQTYAQIPGSHAEAMRECAKMELLRILAIPFQLASLLFVALSSLLLAIALPDLTAQSVALGVFILWIVAVWLTRNAFRLMDEAANGAREASVADIETMNPFGDPRCWVHPALGVVAVVAHYMHPTWPLAPTLLTAALLFPPSIAACAMSGRARDALHPLAVAQVVRRLGRWYLFMIAAVVGCVGIGILLARELGPGWLLYACLELLLLLSYSCIGGVVYLRRIELGFAPRVSPERRAEAAARERESRRQYWLDELFTLARGHNTERALASAELWLNAATFMELPGDVKALVDAGRSWNEPREYARLLRGLLPILLARHQPALALFTFEAGASSHSAFAPADEATTLALATYARETGRHRAALHVLERFLATTTKDSAARSRLTELREALRARI